MDRREWETIPDTYSPDAIDRRGAYEGDIAGLVRWLQVRHGEIEVSKHLLGPSQVKIDGDIAAVETDCLFFQQLEPDVANPPDAFRELQEETRPERSAVRALWGSCRYIDTFVVYSGEWRVKRRDVVVDWVIPYWQTHRNVAGVYWHGDCS